MASRFAFRPPASRRPTGGKVPFAVLAVSILLAGGLWVLLPSPTNVLLVVVDTLRADRLGVYGYERPTSPSIDAFAERAVVFEDALSPAPWTAPAMAGLFTGRSPTALGIVGEPRVLPSDVPTLAEELHGLGYRTSGVVSHLFLSERLGFDRGFAAWDEGEARGHEHVSSEGVTQRALRELTRLAAAPEPFFLFVHYFDPHFEYVAHDNPTLILDRGSELQGVHGDIEALRARARVGGFGEADRLALGDLYDSEIHHTDRHIGQLLAELERLGLFDETLVILTADHGETLLDRPDGWIGHTRTLYQEVLRVPLIVKPAGRVRPRRERTPVSLLDLRATVLAEVGRAGSESTARRAPSILRPPGSLAGRALFASTYRSAGLELVRRGRWKLVRDRGTGVVELYDLRADPLERRNLAGVVGELRRELEAQLEAHHEPLWEALPEKEEEKGSTFSLEELERLRALGYG